jgi:hypothetical protein
MGRFRYVALILCSHAGIASPALASFHIIDIAEVYSNADGSVQFVELIAGFDFQTALAQTRIVAHNADGSVSTIVLDLSTNFLALDDGETVLIATASFQAVAGFAPDYIIPACARVSFPDGRVIFQNDAGTQRVDSVAFGAYTGVNTGFGTPAVALPADGVNSLTRVGNSGNNSLDFGARAATPKRNDGTTVTFMSAPSLSDCDASALADLCEMAAGSLADVNNNDIPDVCEDRGDFDGDGDVDADDYKNVFDCFDGPNGGILLGCDEEDLNGDETIDFLDAAEFQNAFGTPPP